MNLLGKIQDLASGFVNNFKFSNRFPILYNRIFRRNARLQTYIWKNTYYFLCNSSLKDHISVQEIFCDRMYDPFLAACKLGPALRYVNVGANVGAFDIRLLSLGFTIATGVAVDLNAHTCQRCLVNFQANGLSATQLLNAGIAERDGEMDFAVSELSLSDTIFSPAAQAESGGKQVFRVKLLTLSSLLEQHARGVERFDLLKLDCEQAEYGIIRSTPPEVLARFRNILIEFHPPPQGESYESALAKLESAGFQNAMRQSSGRDMFLVLFTAKPREGNRPASLPAS